MSQEIVQSEQQTDEDVLVKVRDLKTYYSSEQLIGGQPVKAVDGVSFDISRGETLGLVGESGCGKTTLGRTLLQLETPTGGEIRFDGTDITTLSGYELKEWRRNAQMVFQDPDSSLNQRMTVGEIVREPLDVYEWKTPEQRRRLFAAVDATDGHATHRRRVGDPPLWRGRRPRGDGLRRHRDRRWRHGRCCGLIRPEKPSFHAPTAATVRTERPSMAARPTGDRRTAAVSGTASVIARV